MKKDVIIDYFIKNGKTLFEPFELIVKSDSDGIGIIILDRSEYVLNRITIWISNKGTYTEFVPSINYTVIENIVQPIFNSFSLGTGMYIESEISTIYMKDVEQDLYKSKIAYIKPTTIKNFKDLECLTKDISLFTATVAKPFFRKWNELDELNSFLTTLPQNKLAYVLGKGATFKKALIFKICKNEGFIEYFEKIYNFYTERYLENPDGERTHKHWNDIAIAMKDVLDNLPDVDFSPL